MSESPLLQLEDVSRVLAGRAVVENVNFQLRRGTVLGLLGVNGAGKTTTLRMIAGLLAPSRGRVLIDGADLREHPEALRGRLGYLPERAPLYAELRVDEHLRLCARLQGVARAAVAGHVARAIERCDLGSVRRRLLGNLSKGFQQRAGIAAALVHEPALIVLDEPASGLDPLQAVQIRALIRALGQQHAVILSTHLLPDVEACCDRVAILDRGRLRHDAPLAAAANAAVRVTLDTALDAAQWRKLPLVKTVQADGAAWRVELGADATASDLAAAIVAQVWRLRELRSDAATLEQMFLRIASAEPAAAA